MTAQVLPQPAEPESANLDCIHCGICLSVCPTYLQLGSEVDSPRGRIYLINALGEKRIPPTSPTFERHMQLCLECRACESACPSGVRFSLMMNEARKIIRETRRPSAWETFLRRFIFELAFPNRQVMHACFRLLRLYQKSGLQRLVRSTGLLGLFSGPLQGMEALLPEVPRTHHHDLPATAPRQGRARVAFFEGCLMPELFGQVQEATLRVLRRNEVSVCSPTRQACCGALHLHDGEMKGALELARRNIDAFENDEADYVVVNAAGCGAMLKEYGHLLRDDPAYAARARAFSARVKDIAEFLALLGIATDMAPLNLRVTYDDPCHLLHGQGIKEAPRNLLKSIPGLELVELTDADRCCGSAGVYNITQPEMSARILEDKIANIERTGARVVATGNPGCMLQIQAGLRARNLAVTVVHPVELLDRAYRESKVPALPQQGGTVRNRGK